MDQADPAESAVNWDSQSLTESVTDYPIQNGRRYHRYHEGTYIYPNDEAEIDRQDMQHAMLKLLNDGRIFFAPLQNPKTILDVGTGSGIWPVEMASFFPNAEITGTDLSAVQPTEVPPNVHFLIDDATEKDWLWPDNHFDHIHTSMLLGSLGDFEEMLRTAFKYVKPGGYMESHEYDITLRCDDGTLPPEDPECRGPYAMQNWVGLQLHSTSELLDPPRPLTVANELADMMRRAGFVDVQEHIRKVPITPWPEDPRMRRIGMWNQRNWLDGLAGFSYVSFGPRGLMWTRDEIEVYLVNVRKSLMDLSYHVYNNFHVVVGRKPER